MIYSPCETKGGLNRHRLFFHIFCLPILKATGMLSRGFVLIIRYANEIPPRMDSFDKFTQLSDAQLPPLVTAGKPQKRIHLI